LRRFELPFLTLHDTHFDDKRYFTDLTNTHDLTIELTKEKRTKTTSIDDADDIEA